MKNKVKTKPSTPVTHPPLPHHPMPIWFKSPTGQKTQKL